MKAEFEKLISQKLTGIVCFSKVTFVESRKFTKQDTRIPKSLYLTFAAYNEKQDALIRVSYCVTTKTIDLTFHPIF